MSKKIALSLIVLILVLVVVLLMVNMPRNKRQHIVSEQTAPRIDVCDEPYVWDVIARDYIGGQLKSFVAQSVEMLACEGCFKVILLADGIEGVVELENWTLKRYTYGDKEYERPDVVREQLGVL
ncbi:MAG: hypothetical protein AAB490_03020 [Patescibacteria group bacterium]